MGFDTDDRHDLPLDPETMDIVCRLEPDGTHRFNVPRRHVHHSPTGWRWGYGGSGPADFALNVLALFLPPATAAPPEERAELYDGSAVHPLVWEHYQEFKREVLGRLPEEGGTIAGAEVRAWLRARGVEPAR